MSGTCASSPQVEVTADLIATLVTRAGYTHELFTPASGDGRGPPLPGAGVLLLMGGLVEQSGQLDDAVALLELSSVRFRKMLFAGSTLRVQIRPLEASTTSSGKVVQRFQWTGVDGDGDHVVEAEALMLMNTRGCAVP